MKAITAERNRNTNAQTTTTKGELQAAAIRAAFTLKELLELAPTTATEIEERRQGAMKCLDALADFRDAVRSNPDII